MFGPSTQASAVIYARSRTYPAGHAAIYSTDIKRTPASKITYYYLSVAQVESYKRISHGINVLRQSDANAITHCHCALQRNALLQLYIPITFLSVSF